jgi:hypothetical protein
MVARTASASTIITGQGATVPWAIVPSTAPSTAATTAASAVLCLPQNGGQPPQARYVLPVSGPDLDTRIIDESVDSCRYPVEMQCVRPYPALAVQNDEQSRTPQPELLMAWQPADNALRNRVTVRRGEARPGAKLTRFETASGCCRKPAVARA